jgi:hypothetical protein
MITRLYARVAAVADEPDGIAGELTPADTPVPEDELPVVAATTVPDAPAETPTAGPVASQAQGGTANDDAAVLDG